MRSERRAGPVGLVEGRGEAGMLGRRIVGVVMTGLVVWGVAGCGATDADLVHAVARIRGTDLGTDSGTGIDAGGGADSGTSGDTGGWADSGTGIDTGGGTGTWDDSVSGLTWQNPVGTGNFNWSAAKSYCASLSLAGGGWRLPTISELRSLIRGCTATQTGGSCGVTDLCLSYNSCRGSSCGGCASKAGPANGCYWPDAMEGYCGWYWSSSPVADRIDEAFYVGFGYGYVRDDHTRSENHVRCVR